MSITQTAAIAKCRLRLQDRSARRDGTAISTPRFSDTDLATALNDAIRDRQPLIQKADPTFYQQTFDFIGQTNAVTADAANANLPVVQYEQYDLPAAFKEIIRLTRKDQPSQPTVRLVDRQYQDGINYRGGGDLFAGFAVDYPSASATSPETVALVTSNQGGTAKNRLRIMPAPASTSYTYRLYYVRVPTEPSSGSHTLDIPSTFTEIVVLDAALELAASVNLATLPTIERLLMKALAAHEDDPGGRNAGRHVVGDVRP